MHVVIVGCGRVGSSLARSLVDASHTVSIIDRRQQAFERLGDLGPDEGCTRLIGIGFDRDVLELAGIRNAAALAAVTNGDNSNILVARVARENFGVERVVARIYDPKRAAIYQRLGIATVATVSWTTERVMRRVLGDSAAVEWVDPSAKISVVERVVGPGWAGRKLLDVEGAVGGRVVALSRLGSGMMPSAELVAQEGDVVYLALPSETIPDADDRIAAAFGAKRH